MKNTIKKILEYEEKSEEDVESIEKRMLDHLKQLKIDLGNVIRYLADGNRAAHLDKTVREDVKGLAKDLLKVIDEIVQGMNSLLSNMKTTMDDDFFNKSHLKELSSHQLVEELGKLESQIVAAIKTHHTVVEDAINKEDVNIRRLTSEEQSAWKHLDVDLHKLMIEIRDAATSVENDDHAKRLGKIIKDAKKQLPLYLEGIIGVFLRELAADKDINTAERVLLEVLEDYITYMNSLTKEGFATDQIVKDYMQEIRDERNKLAREIELHVHLIQWALKLKASIYQLAS